MWQGAYDASQHPGVVAKRRTAEEVMEEFISSFEGEVKDGKVSEVTYRTAFGFLTRTLGGGQG